MPESDTCLCLLQLTKEQLLSVLPLLTPHLQNPSFVIHTYAALTIERILFIKQEGSPMYVVGSCSPVQFG